MSVDHMGVFSGIDVDFFPLCGCQSCESDFIPIDYRLTLSLRIDQAQAKTLPQDPTPGKKEFSRLV